MSKKETFVHRKPRIMRHRCGFGSGLCVISLFGRFESWYLKRHRVWLVLECKSLKSAISFHSNTIQLNFAHLSFFVPSSASWFFFMFGCVLCCVLCSVMCSCLLPCVWFNITNLVRIGHGLTGPKPVFHVTKNVKYNQPRTFHRSSILFFFHLFLNEHSLFFGQHTTIRITKHLAKKEKIIRQFRCARSIFLCFHF